MIQFTERVVGSGEKENSPTPIRSIGSGEVYNFIAARAFMTHGFKKNKLKERQSRLMAS